MEKKNKEGENPQMANILTKLFGPSTKVLVKDGTFNNVEGEYNYYDYSQRTTNNGSYNFIGNTLHNVHNSGHQVICMFPSLSSSDWFTDCTLLDHGRNAPHDRSANGQVVAADARAIRQFFFFFTVVHLLHEDLNICCCIDNYAHTSSPSLLAGNMGTLQSQAPGPTQIYGSHLSTNAPQSGNHFVYVQPGDIRPMTRVEVEFVKHQMAQMHEEMTSEFPDDTFEEEETSTEMRPQSVSADLQHHLSICEPPIPQPTAQSLTIAQRTSQSFDPNPQHQVESYTQFSVLGQHNTNLNAIGVSATQAHTQVSSSSPNNVQASESARHIIIHGDHTEVDNSVHKFNLNSHIVANNVIENSFNEQEEVIGKLALL